MIADTFRPKRLTVRLEMYPGSYKVHPIDRRVTVCVEVFVDESPRPTDDVEELHQYVRGEIKRRLSRVPGVLVADPACQGGAGPKFSVRGRVVPLDEASPRFWITIGDWATGRLIAAEQFERHADDKSRLATEITAWILRYIQTKVEIDLDLPRFLRQTVKTQNSLNGELSHGSFSKEVHA